MNEETKEARHVVVEQPDNSRLVDDDYTAFVSSNACLIGSVLGGRYRLDSMLGVGGWSTVYSAYDLTLKRSVAVKVLHAHLTIKSASVQRFRIEAEATSRISHPNLVSIYDFGLGEQEQPYIVMELMEGSPLDTMIRAPGRLSSTRVVPLFAQICAALEVVHAKGMVHRDVKPNNIVITTDEKGVEKAKLLDFGLVKMFVDSGVRQTATGETIGTPSYMSPEQCLGYPIDPRSDIYSLGCVMYEALTGRPPFVETSALACMHRHVHEAAPACKDVAPDVCIPSSLEYIVKRTLAKNPDDRFGSARELGQALMSIDLAATDASTNMNPVRSATPKSRTTALVQ